jgi:hypothetical protein
MQTLWKAQASMMKAPEFTLLMKVFLRYGFMGMKI